MANLPGVFPDADKWLIEAAGRSPDSRDLGAGDSISRALSTAHLPALARSGIAGRFFSLTVAGAVEALHLVPEHLAAA
jgi:hypothetical protein